MPPRSTRAATAALTLASVPKKRTAEERALEAWYTNFSHPPDDPTRSKRFDRAGGALVSEIIASLVDHERSRAGGDGHFTISSKKVCSFLDAKEKLQPHRVRRIGVKGAKHTSPAFMMATSKGKLPPKGNHKVSMDGREKKQLRAAEAENSALKDEVVQLKLEAMLAASPSASDPPSSSPTPPPTEVKADSGHRYSPAFMLATNELFSVSKQISAATAPHVIAFVTYFMLMELWRVRVPWLGAEPCLPDIINMTPSMSTIGTMRRYAGDVRDCTVALHLAMAMVLCFLVFDDGNKKGIKRKVILLVGYNFVDNCISEHLLDATTVYAGTGSATASTLSSVVQRFGVTELGGQAGDNASDVAAAGAEMAKLYTSYIFVGYVLHIMQLIIVNACVVAFGDDCGMGVNTALRMVFIINYLQTEFRNEWNLFRSKTTGADACGVVPLGSKGRWWSLTVAFTAIVQHCLILIAFTAFLIKSKVASGTNFMTMVHEVDEWLRNDKVISDMIFMSCFCTVWWNVHMKWFHGHDSWQENLQSYKQRSGYRCASMPYYLYFMMRELRNLTLNSEWLREWREFNQKLSPAQRANSVLQGQKMLDVALNMAEKHFKAWWTKLLPCGLFRHDVGADREVTVLVAKTMLAYIDDEELPSIPAHLAKVTIHFDRTCSHTADTADLLEHMFQFVKLEPDLLGQEGTVFTADSGNVELLRTVLEFDMDPSKMDKSDDRHTIAWVKFELITKTERGRPFHSQLAERGVNKMNPNAKKGHTNERADLMGIQIAADDQHAEERAQAAHATSDERDFEKLLEGYGLEMSADEIKEEYVSAQRVSSSWLRKGQPVRQRFYRIKSRKMFAEQIRLAWARIQGQTTPEALEKLAEYKARVTKEKLTRMDIDTASTQPKFDEMEEHLAKEGHQWAILSTYEPSTADPVMPQSATGTWDLSKTNNKEMGGDTVVKFTKAVAIDEAKERDIALPTYVSGKRKGEVRDDVTKASIVEQLISHNEGNPVIERLAGDDGGKKQASWVGDRPRASSLAAPPPIARTAADADTAPLPSMAGGGGGGGGLTNRPQTAGMEGEDQMQVVDEIHEPGNTARKAIRRDDGGAQGVVTGNRVEMSPARPGRDGKRAARSSPDRGP